MPDKAVPLDYEHIFRISDEVQASAQSRREDYTDGDVYIFDDPHLLLAIDVAIASGSPLLVYGAPGSGKSSLARNIARIMGVEAFSTVVNSRTEPLDLLWEYDAVGRLADAQAGLRKAQWAQEYYTKGILWQAFKHDPARNASPGAQVRCVVLIDEVDKAGPDVPDSLLVPLGNWRFTTPTGEHVDASGQAPLVILTSNNERELSRAFTRRCIVFRLRDPDKAHLIKVAQARLGSEDAELFGLMADYLLDQGRRPGRPSASTAEFLDAVRACQSLRVRPGSPAWEVLAQVALDKTVHEDP